MIACTNCQATYKNEEELAWVEVEGEVVQGCKYCKTDEHLMDVE